MHSWLIVPADSEAKLARVPDVGAGAIVLDLVGDRSAEQRTAARERALRFLTEQGPGGAFARWVRINALETPWWREDLVAVIAGAPDGIVLARAADPAQVQALAAEIYELEQRNGIGHGRVRIVPQIGATAAGALAAPLFAGEVHPRLAGLSWDAAELARSLGARRTHDPSGGWSDPLRRLRADIILAARARGLQAIETLFGDIRDGAGMRAAAKAARADGFTGMCAIHPAQVAVIAGAFAPSAAELAEATAIVALFDGFPEASALPLEGRMVDRARLDEARRLLA